MRLAAVFIFVVVIVEPVSAEVVRITSVNSVLEGRQLSVNREFGGHVGDYIQLEQGEHKLSVRYDHGYTLRFELVASDSGVEAQGFRGSRFDDCINNRVSPFELLPWPEGTLTSETAGVFSLTLGEPMFRNRGDMGECISEPSLMSLRVLGGASLKISSSPKGAEIFIGGDRIGTTDLSKVIPYKRGNRDLRIVFRHPGFANCLRSVRLPGRGDFEATVDCTLLKIKKP